jgi:hypothetical protein
MGAARHSRDSIAQTLQNVAAQLGKTTLSKKEVQPHVALSAINYHFGNLSTALKAAGLSVAVQDPGAISKRLRLDDDLLFASLWEVEQKIGHAPNLSEYRANGGRFSNRPFSKRFGDWVSVLQHFRKWKVDSSESVVNVGIAPMDSNGNNDGRPESVSLQTVDEGS